MEASGRLARAAKRISLDGGSKRVRPTPVFSERALLIHDGARPTLVVGDLHVGLETELRRAGAHLPSQTERMRERLLRLVAETGARRIVVIGDLKHTIPVSSFQEARELPRFFAEFPVPVELVRGNHDVDLEPLPNVAIHSMYGLLADGGGADGAAGLFHGHVWPAERVMTARTIVTCHNHPMVMLVDDLGHRHKEPCWVRADFTPAARERYAQLPPDAQLIVMPAFNELLGGVAFNAREGERVMGPLWANGLADVDAARLYTLDGVDLGTVDELRRFGDAGRTVRRGRGRRTLRD